MWTSSELVSGSVKLTLAQDVFDSAPLNAKQSKSKLDGPLCFFAAANLRPELECEYASRLIPLSRLGHPETAFAQHGNHS
jgi:hypothetical protein